MVPSQGTFESGNFIPKTAFFPLDVILGGCFHVVRGEWVGGRAACRDVSAVCAKSVQNDHNVVEFLGKRVNSSSKWSSSGPDLRRSWDDSGRI